MRAFKPFLITFLSLGVAAYAVVGYAVLPLGTLVLPDMKESFEAHAVALYTHVFAAAFALALGPFQFSLRLRERNRQLHRWMGRLYLGVGVLLGGLAGLVMSLHAQGGMAAKLGFGSLAVCWLVSGFLAYRAIRRGDVTEHRKWMTRNFALTLAAVSLRLYMPLSMVAGVPFGIAYPIIAWLCWVPNLLVAERLFDSRQQHDHREEGTAAHRISGQSS